MTPEQLAQLIEQGTFDFNDVSSQTVDWTLIGALYIVARKNISTALVALDRMMFNKPDVRDAFNEHMSQVIPKLVPDIQASATIYVARMVGRVHGRNGVMLGVADDGTWSTSDPTRRAATLTLIAESLKEGGYAADILLGLPAGIVRNDDIISVIRSGLTDPNVLLALARRARDGSDAMRETCREIADDLAVHGNQGIVPVAKKFTLPVNNTSFFSLPGYIQEIYLAHEYDEFLDQTVDTFRLAEDKRSLIHALVIRIWTKEVLPEQIKEEVERVYAFGDNRSDLFAREIVLNAVLLFPEYLGDHIALYQSLGGKAQDALLGSRLYLAFQRLLLEAFQKAVENVKIADIEKERRDMTALFRSRLVEHFYSEDSYKPALNGTLFALLDEVEQYDKEILNALYANEQKIGTAQLNGTEPSVANWIKDFLAFSQGEGTSLTLAKYLTQGPAVIKLSARDKEAVHKLLQTYMVLKGFPNSLFTLPLDQWKIIPYATPEGGTLPSLQELTQTQRTGSGTNSRERGQAQIRSAKLSQTPIEPDHNAKLTKTPPTPTITIVEAPAVAPVVVPSPAPMAKPALPLTEPVAERGQAQIREYAKLSQTPIEPDPKLIQTPTVQKIDFAVCAEAVLAKAGVALGEDYRERVKNIIVTRLRNIRNVIETKDRLCAPTTEGGAGLLPDDAEKLLQEANVAIKAIADGTLVEYVPPPVILSPKEESQKVTEQRDPSATPRDDKEGVRDDIPKLVIKEVGGVPTIVEKAEKKTNGKKKEEKTTELATELATEQSFSVIPSEAQRSRGIPVSPETTGSLPSVRDDKASGDDKEGAPVQEPAAENLPPVPVPPHLEDAKDIPVVVTTQASGSPRLRGDDAIGTRDDKVRGRDDEKQDDSKKVGAGKKPIPDVKAPPRLVGPIDELRALTIKDIRRISEDPVVATQKIAEKINALGKESLSKKAEAINAWKESPVYQLYLEIGQLNLGKDMDNLMEERKVAGKEYLTAKEFDALLDLNERLRF